MMVLLVPSVMLTSVSCPLRIRVPPPLRMPDPLPQHSEMVATELSIADPATPVYELNISKAPLLFEDE
jgi:hypothetical protein